MSANVHLDEETPYMHLVFIPVVHAKDKKGNKIDKVACNEFLKGKDSYRELQDNFYKYITDKGFILERGQAGNTEHVSIETLKNLTDFNEINTFLNSEAPKPVELKTIPNMMNAKYANEHLLSHYKRKILHLENKILI